MKLGAVKRLLRTDLPDAPEWVSGLLQHFNAAVESVLTAVGGSLTVGDNLAGRYVDLDVRTLAGYAGGSWTTINFTLPFTARAVIVAQLLQVETVYTPVKTSTSLDWLQLGDTVQVRWVAGLANSKRYALRVLALP